MELNEIEHRTGLEPVSPVWNREPMFIGSPKRTRGRIGDLPEGSGVLTSWTTDAKEKLMFNTSLVG
jgi:hypothetical protein